MAAEPIGSSAQEATAHPRIAPPDEWREERVRLLKEEKELTKHADRVSAERRRLPMVRLEKEYVFDTPDGKHSLLDLFDGRTQLIVYHFMFDPEWEKGCPGCTGFVNALGDLSTLAERDATFALISRAPLAKLEKYKAEKGWKWPWASSFGSDFNYDFHATLDSSVAPVEYNYKTVAELQKREDSEELKGESHGVSVFFRIGDEAFHTYSTYARGVENLVDSYRLLEVTPYGRQEAWEDSPPGWPQRPTYR